MPRRSTRNSATAPAEDSVASRRPRRAATKSSDTPKKEDQKPKRRMTQPRKAKNADSTPSKVGRASLTSKKAVSTRLTRTTRKASATTSSESKTPSTPQSSVTQGPASRKRTRRQVSNSAKEPKAGKRKRGRPPKKRQVVTISNEPHSESDESEVEKNGENSDDDEFGSASQVTGEVSESRSEIGMIGSQSEGEEESDLEELHEKLNTIQKSLSVKGIDPSAKANQIVKFPETSKAHWDYLLKEMAWMANDFKQERKWKDKTARKTARDAVKGVTRRANKWKQKERDEQAKRRKVAVGLAKGVKKFWDKVDRIVVFKHSSKDQASKQKEMDKQLDFLVGQTERYAGLLAQKLSAKASTAPSSSQFAESQSSSPSARVGSSTAPDDSCKPPKGTILDKQIDEGNDSSSRDEDWDNDTDEADDETTMAAAEEVQSSGEQEAEMLALKEDAELSREELLQKYGPPPSLAAAERNSMPNSESEDEWEASSVGVDDETTLMEEEAINGLEDSVSEVNALQEEALLSREELIARYGAPGSGAEHLIKDSSDAEDDEMDDNEWEGDSLGVDDETTLQEEEQLDGIGRDGAKEEIDALKQDAQLSREELIAKYGAPGVSVEKEDREAPDERSEESDLEWDNDSAGVDDETTMVEEELVGDADDTQAELEALKTDAELSQEELLAKYGPPGSDVTISEVATESGELGPPDASMSILSSDSDDDRAVGDDWKSVDGDTGDDETTLAQQEVHEDKTEVANELQLLKEEAQLDPEALRAKYSFNASDSSSDEEVVVESDGHVVPSPFLMPRNLQLRIYQRDGLDWLVSLYERRLNGILADEMGLGKTIQTIALLAHLAGSEGVWGPHLIVVPTSVLLNWEMEIKRWCPGFKVITYYGSIKERKLKRQGWSKPNAFHICITSYQLAVQDAQVFKRKKWVYMILDEAHNIKNFRSQRWQTLLNFNTKRRLLLTGTPLQNSLMELWSLMHFLMPHIFQSQTEFKYWFSNPLNQIVEGKPGIELDRSSAANPVVQRLHSVIRPFLLRRLKVDVAKQLPKKYEHVVMVDMSKRQQYLYEDFISRSSTKDTISTGGYLGMMSVLMKLRMVCNHPDIFEPRLVSSSFIMEPIDVVAPIQALRAEEPLGPLDGNVSAADYLLGGVGRDMLLSETGKANGRRIQELAVPRQKLIEEITMGAQRRVDRQLKQQKQSDPLFARLMKTNTDFARCNRQERGREVKHAQDMAISIALKNDERCTAPHIVSPCFGYDVYSSVKVPGNMSQFQVTEYELKPIVAEPTVLPSQPGIPVSSSGGVVSSLHIKPKEALLSSESTPKVVVLSSESTSKDAVLSSESTPKDPVLNSDSTPKDVVLNSESTPKDPVLNSESTPKDAVLNSESTPKDPVLNSESKQNETISNTKLMQKDVNGKGIKLPSVATGNTTNVEQNPRIATEGKVPNPSLTKSTTTVPNIEQSASVAKNSLNDVQSTQLQTIPNANTSTGKGTLSESVVNVPVPKSKNTLENSTSQPKSSQGVGKEANQISTSNVQSAGAGKKSASTSKKQAKLKTGASSKSVAPLIDLSTEALRALFRSENSGLRWAKVSHSVVRDRGESRLSSSVGLISTGLVRGIGSWIKHLEPTIRRFVFRTPKARGPGPTLCRIGREVCPSKAQALREAEDRLGAATTLDSAHSPEVFHPVAIRQKLNFPDRMLVQYDCGKLQVLATMLHDLKRKGHRVLIFTQMTKMLDILEIFLNIHGHVYFRLDGSTKVDDRQVMMERFNRDDKIFAFILSTRSGGLGINLVGADTVIFYDSDWNPSMDAQAQDRAHRIGQTRDVHIYRLVTRHSIEENILRKANQKRHLNKLTVEDGAFRVDAFLKSAKQVQSLLASEGEEVGLAEQEEPGTNQEDEVSAVEVTRAMAAVEDASDQEAAVNLEREVQDELDIFNDSTAPPPEKEPKNNPKQVGLNVEGDPAVLTMDQYVALESQLRPVEKYAIEFRTRHLLPAGVSNTGLGGPVPERTGEATDAEWNLDQLEAIKEEMEDLGDEELITASRDRKQRAIRSAKEYDRVRRAVLLARKTRKITGSAWVREREEGSKKLYYRNVDTHETTYEKPLVLELQAEFAKARKDKWNGMSEDLMVYILQFMPTYPDRATMGCASWRWSAASRSPHLAIWVEPSLAVPKPIAGASTGEDDEDPGSSSEWFTLGSRVEYLDPNDGLWNPGVVVDVLWGRRLVLATGHEEEESKTVVVPRAQVRHDTGVRYTWVRLPEGVEYGLHNKHLRSRFACGVAKPMPVRVPTLEAALALAPAGSTIVLEMGFHALAREVDTAGKRVRVVGESRVMETVRALAGVRSAETPRGSQSRKEQQAFKQAVTLTAGKAAGSVVSQRSVLVATVPFQLRAGSCVFLDSLALVRHVLPGQAKVARERKVKGSLHSLVTVLSASGSRTMEYAQTGAVVVAARARLLVADSTIVGSKRERAPVVRVVKRGSLVGDNACIAHGGSFGLVLATGATCLLARSRVQHNAQSGLLVLDGLVHLERVRVSQNKGFGIQTLPRLALESVQCDLTGNALGEQSTTHCGYSAGLHPESHPFVPRALKRPEPPALPEDPRTNQLSPQVLNSTNPEVAAQAAAVIGTWHLAVARAKESYAKALEAHSRRLKEREECKGILVEVADVVAGVVEQVVKVERGRLFRASREQRANPASWYKHVVGWKLLKVRGAILNNSLSRSSNTETPFVFLPQVVPKSVGSKRPQSARSVTSNISGKSKAAGVRKRAAGSKSTRGRKRGVSTGRRVIDATSQQSKEPETPKRVNSRRKRSSPKASKRARLEEGTKEETEEKESTSGVTRARGKRQVRAPPLLPPGTVHPGGGF